MAGTDYPIKPFAFDRVFRFDVPASKEEVNSVGIADLDARVAGLEEELEAARRERDEAVAAAHADGLAEGLVQARAERAEAQLAATDALHAALDELAAELADITQRLTRDCADVALAAAEMLAGHALQHQPGRAFEEALARALEQVAFGTQLHVRVHPESHDHFAEIAAQRADRHAAHPVVTVVMDEGIAPNDAHISWIQGGLIVNAADRRAAVVAELAPLLNDAAA